MAPEARIFGQVLRHLRKERKLSQEALAFDSGVDRTFISDMERGVKQPTITTIYRLARALNLSVVELIAAVDDVVQEEIHGTTD